jgi:hypothetical protein
MAIYGTTKGGLAEPRCTRLEPVRTLANSVFVCSVRSLIQSKIVHNRILGVTAEIFRRLLFNPGSQHPERPETSGIPRVW